MNRCSFCEWIPILPLPVWPLAGQFLLGQNVVVGSMTLLLALRGNIATRSMAGPPFALQLHRTTVWCGATWLFGPSEKRELSIKVMPTRPSVPVISVSAVSSRSPALAGDFIVLRTIETSPDKVLI